MERFDLEKEDKKRCVCVFTYARSLTVHCQYAYNAATSGGGPPPIIIPSNCARNLYLSRIQHVYLFQEDLYYIHEEQQKSSSYRTTTTKTKEEMNCKEKTMATTRKG